MTTLVSAASHILDIPEGHHVFQILDLTGHTTHTFDPTDLGEVQFASLVFKQQIKEGRQAFGMTTTNQNPTKLSRFDPQVEKTIFSTTLVGG